MAEKSPEKATSASLGTPFLPRLRILDLSWQMPGPYATKLLADLGADVISVEPPGGDPVRAYPTLFQNMNLGKRCMVANLKDEADRKYVLELATDADVLVEGFRPTVADRLGVGYEAIVNTNPGIIYCSISGYGQDGQWAADPGHDLNYEALAGALGGEKTGTPQIPFLPVADLAGGLMAGFSILAACQARASSGVGERIDVSMTAVVASWMSSRAGATLGDEVDMIADSPHYGLFQCGTGGHIALGVVFEDQFWMPVCDVLELKEFKALQFPERVARSEEIKTRLRLEFQKHDRNLVVTLLRSRGVPITPVNTALEGFSMHGGQWVNGIPIFAHPVKYRNHTLGSRETDLGTGRKTWLT